MFLIENVSDRYLAPTLAVAMVSGCAGPVQVVQGDQVEEVDCDEVPDRKDEAGQPEATILDDLERMMLITNDGATLSIGVVGGHNGHMALTTACDSNFRSGDSVDSTLWGLKTRIRMYLGRYFCPYGQEVAVTRSAIHKLAWDFIHGEDPGLCAKVFTRFSCQ